VRAAWFIDGKLEASSVKQSTADLEKRGGTKNRHVCWEGDEP